jgi:hypothetical protein
VIFTGQSRFSQKLYESLTRDDRVAQYYLLDALGCHAARSRQLRLAAQLLGAAETIRTGAGAAVIPTIAPLLAQAQESSIAALGARQFETEFKAGQHLSRDAAADLALGESAHGAAAAQDNAGAGLLGKREVEVAQLVADGLATSRSERACSYPSIPWTATSAAS